MEPIKKLIRGWGFSTFLLVFLLFSVSCKYELVKETTLNYNDKKNASDYKDFILPPSEISASNGLSKIVNLEWGKVPGAVQYQIYSAATPYDTFTKISETKSNETQISIDEEAGVTKYYCICSVNYYGTVSSKSVVVSGSTLSVPIITEISASQEGNSLTVNWWMDNCSTETYEDKVQYNIGVYANASSNMSLQNLTATGDKRSLVINGLNSTTEYYILVEVENTETHDKEVSNRTNAQTAHKVIPAAPVIDSVSQGDSVDGITLSWKLPEKVWYRTNDGTSGFALYPLYFKIYRKRVDEAQNDFVKIGELSFTEDTYSQGGAATFTDDTVTAERGKQYEYFVQSFTDIPNNTSGKEITSDSSKSQVVTGWKQSVPEFYIKTDYIQSENSETPVFTKITFDSHLSFETFGVPYTYILVRKHTALDSEEFTGDAVVESFSSLAEVNDYLDEFTDPQGQTGYYYYTMYICPKDTQSTDYETAKYQLVEALGKYIVTHDVSALPQINTFTVADGYKDKYVLNWDYNQDYTYIIHYRDMNGETLGEEQTYELTASDISESLSDTQDSITYNHEADSGTRRDYSLEAFKTGLSTYVRPDDSETKQLYLSLGTPEPHIDSYDYDKITVKWASVQMASGEYVINAYYEDDNQKTEIITTENHSITQNTDEYTCVVSAPAGYNDAAQSGKNIKLMVTAISSIHDDNTTSACIDVCTLGPALTGTAAAQLVQSASIDVDWQPVKGASGYFIKRTCSTGTDTYYYDGQNILLQGEAVSSNRATIKFNGTSYIFTDKYCEPDIPGDTTNTYQINQSHLSWGIPFDYFIIPVKDSKGPVFEYTNAQAVTKSGATIGYGLNVMAQKADSSVEQIIEWTLPLFASSYTPTIYTRKAGTTENRWVKIKQKRMHGTNAAAIDPEDPAAAYEYLVSYFYNDNEIVNKVSPSFLEDTTTGLSSKEQRAGYTYQDNNSRENANKGYLLYTELRANYGGTDCSEDVSWDKWDYEKRVIGPDSAELFIKNYNISTEWQKVAELSGELFYASQENLTNTTITKIDNMSLKLKPTSFMTGTTSSTITQGPLMVLRDAKHYYSLVLTKGDKSGEIGRNDTVYAYRDLKEEEFAKAVMLVFADGMRQLGRLEFDSKIERNDANHGGKVTADHDGQTSKSYSYEFTNYGPLFETPSGRKSYIFIISTAEAQTIKRHLGTQGGWPASFNTVQINVEKADPLMPDSYSGRSISFTMSGHDDASITVDGKTITLNSDALRRIFVPCKISPSQNIFSESTDGDFFKNKDYGWWVE